MAGGKRTRPAGRRRINASSTSSPPARKSAGSPKACRAVQQPNNEENPVSGKKETWNSRVGPTYCKTIAQPSKEKTTDDKLLELIDCNLDRLNKTEV